MINKKSTLWEFSSVKIHFLTGAFLFALVLYSFSAAHAQISVENSTVTRQSTETVKARENNIELHVHLKDEEGDNVGGSYNIMVSTEPIWFEEVLDFNPPNKGEETFSISVSTPGIYNEVSVKVYENEEWKTIGFFDVTVEAADADRFEFNAISSPQTAGEKFEISITAYDEFDNTATSYTEKAALSDDTGTISPDKTDSFTEGIWTGTVTITTAGENIVITATCTVNSGLNGKSNEFDIVPAPANSQSITEQPSKTTAGEAISPAPAVKLTDEFGNPVEGIEVTLSLNKNSFATGTETTRTTGLDGTAAFTGIVIESADTDYQLTFNANAIDVDNVISVLFNVTPAAADYFQFDSIASPQTAGEEFEITITAYDVHGNTDTAYAGTADLSETTETISPDKTGSFTEGIWTGNVTISSAQSNIQITAEDGSITGSSNQFDIAPGETQYITVSPEVSAVIAGETQAYDAIAYDAYDNEIKDVTADTQWSVEEEAGGYWEDNVYTSEKDGEWTITGEYGVFEATATLNVGEFVTPVLKWAEVEGYENRGVNPAFGSEKEEFMYKVKYRDPSDSLKEIKLIINRGGGEEEYEMKHKSGEISQGAIFESTTSFSFSYSDNPRYRFYARNNSTVAVGEPAEVTWGPVIYDSVVFYGHRPESDKENKSRVIDCSIKVEVLDADIDDAEFEVYQGTGTQEYDYKGEAQFTGSEIKAGKVEFKQGINYIRYIVYEEGSERRWVSGFNRVMIKEFSEPRISLIQPGGGDRVSLRPSFEFEVSRLYYIQSATVTITGPGLERDGQVFYYPGDLDYDISAGILSFTYSGPPLKSGEEYEALIKIKADNKKTAIKSTAFIVADELLSDFLNYPNPFNPNGGGTTFRYYLGHKARVSINIYDNSRSLVKNIVKDEVKLPGQNEEIWDGRNFKGEITANGIYYAEIIAEDKQEHRMYLPVAVLRR